MSSKQQASDKRLSRQAIKIHEAWAFQNGYRQQAASTRIQGPRYNGSDYGKRATNCRASK